MLFFWIQTVKNAKIWTCLPQMVQRVKGTHIVEESQYRKHQVFTFCEIFKVSSIRSKMDDQPGKSLHINDMTEIALLNIFIHLSPQERFKVGSICRRWYTLSRDARLCKQLNLENITYSQFVKFLRSAPSSLTRLRISLNSSEKKFRANLTEFLAELNKSCSSLEILILDNIYYDSRFFLYCSVSKLGQAYLQSQPGKEQRKKGSRRLNYCKKHDDKENNILVPQLLRAISICESFLHLGDSEFCVDAALLPKIEILDFTSTTFYDSSNKTDSIRHCYVRISEFRNLKELYLADTHINLKEMRWLLESSKHLTVLDIENLHQDIQKMIPVVQQFGQSLEKLYLGHKYITDANITDLMACGKKSFPLLKYLCLRHSMVTHNGVQMILNSCRSLEHVNVTLCLVSEDWLQNNEFINGKVIYEKNATRHVYCCYHFKRNHFSESPSIPF